MQALKRTQRALFGRIIAPDIASEPRGISVGVRSLMLTTLALVVEVGKCPVSGACKGAKATISLKNGKTA